ncbi:hypothetical protein [Novispirillum itersonii]|uniref:CopG family transcriptional regulator n=1 Tax=Novispirillum itersonii TaxID=189 RepID=A0A7W9ZIF7_NOVIT|nr:hypothetical protein [Novispirillum itersonii]MBB6211242.1 hypothetical protein [Novispirillum itersonii]
MAIAPKPQRKAAADIDAFIGGAAATPAEVPAPATATGSAKGRKVPVMLRLDEDLLARIDTASRHSYQSRTAWIAGTLAKILKEEGF